MTKLNQESGRSMVEMLGVLAIIGVLSIGGIAGYTMAMNRYRANEIMSAASHVAIVAQTKDGGVGGDASLTDTPDLRAENLGITNIEANREGIVQITGVRGDVASAINSVMGEDVCGANPTDGATCTYNPATRETATFAAS